MELGLCGLQAWHGHEGSGSWACLARCDGQRVGRWGDGGNAYMCGQEAQLDASPAQRRGMAAVTDSALNQRTAADIGAGDGGQRANQRVVATRAASMAGVPCGAAAARRVVAVCGRWPARMGGKLGDSMCHVCRAQASSAASTRARGAHPTAATSLLYFIVVATP